MKITTFEEIQHAEMTVTLGRQQLKVSVYLVDGVLIDTGPSRMHHQLIPLFEQWNINEVILTHHHEDHTGAAKWIQDKKEVPIFIHPKGIQNCVVRMKLPFYRKVFWGERHPFKATPLSETHRSENYQWEVIHTPGHAHDHVSLFLPENGWMFSGDLYVHPYPKSIFSFESIPKIIQSLMKTLSYDFEILFCSHAGIIENGRAVIEKKLHYLEDIQEKVQTMHKKGMSPKEIRKTLFPKYNAINYFSLFESSPQHLVNSILRDKI